MGMTFPHIAYIDTESKIGVYLDKEKYNKNIDYLLTTNNPKEFIESLSEIIKTENHGGVQTVVIDSITNIIESLNIVYLELEKKRTRDRIKKEKPQISNDELDMLLNDVALNVRSYGHINNSNKILKSLQMILSNLGINIVVIAHNKEIKDKNNITIDIMPDVAKNGDYIYDVIIETKIRKNLATLEMEHIAIIKKDTTETFTLGQEINYTNNSDLILKKIEHKLSKSVINEENSNYKLLDGLVDEMKEKQDNREELNELYEEFKNKYLETEDKTRIKKVLKEYNIEKISDVKEIKTVKEILSKI